MALLLNLRHIEDKNIRLEGELSVQDLEIENLDEMIHTQHPVAYDLEAQKLEHAVLVTGSLEVDLDCECVRCLTPFRHHLVLDDWACHLPLIGEDKAAVVSDCIDLTPYIREDIVLAFPQHPLCKSDCSGLASTKQKPEETPGSAALAAPDSSTWAALDKLKLRAK